MNDKLIKAGIESLIKKNKTTFVDRLALILGDNNDFIDFLFDGPLPCNDEVQAKIEKYIISQLPSPDYFKGIKSIASGFSYSNRQVYDVACSISKFYNQEHKPYAGQAAPDEEHPIEIVEEISYSVFPSELS